MNQPKVFHVPSVASGEYRLSKAASIGSGTQGGSVRIYARLRVDD
jgi:hypothetical protein